MIKLLHRFRVPLLLLALLPLGGCAGGEFDELWNAASWLFTGIFSVAIIAISLISVLFALLLGNLMSSFHIFDGGMGETLQLVWSVVRNFVNIGFILILLIIAVRVIIGVGEDSGIGALKKILPKFILAIIAVNLTFFAARFILTTSDVLTTAVFTLPRTVAGEKMIRGLPCPNEITLTKSAGARPFDTDICLEEITAGFTQLATGKGTVTEERAAEKLAKYKEITGIVNPELMGEHEKLAAFFASANQIPLRMVGTKAVPLALMMNMTDLSELLWVKHSVGQTRDLVISALGALITAGVVGIVYFMLFVAFVVRMVVLWIMIIASPAAVLFYVMKDVVPSLADGGDDHLKKFIGYAFMPVFAAVPLSIGMIMIFANNSIDFQDGQYTATSFMAGDLNALIWWVASIIIIWFGTQEAIKKGGELAAKATDKIHQGVNTFVGGMAGTLKYAPLFPGSNMSVHGMMQTPKVISQKIENAAAERTERRAKGFLGHLPKSWYSLSASAEQIAQESAKLATALRKGTKDERKAALIEKLDWFQKNTSTENAQQVKGSEITTLKRSLLDSELVQAGAGREAVGKAKTAEDIVKALSVSGNTIGSEIYVKALAALDGMEGRTNDDETPTVPSGVRAGDIHTATGVESAIAGQKPADGVKPTRVSNATIKIGKEDEEIFKEGDNFYFQTTDSGGKPQFVGMYSKNDILDPDKKEEDFRKIMKGLAPEVANEMKEKLNTRISKLMAAGKVDSTEVGHYETFLKEKLGKSEGEIKTLLKNFFDDVGGVWRRKK